MKPPPPSDNRPPSMPSGPLDQIGVEEVFNTSGSEIFLEEKFHSEVLQKICKEGCEVLGAERSLIVQLGKDYSIPREILCTHQIPLDFLDELRASTKKSILEEAFQENRVKVFSNIDRESHVFDPESVRRMGLCGVCAIPLFVEETTSCALVLYHMTPKEYTDQDRRLAESFGSLASTTIKNAQLTLKNRVRATQLEIVDQVAKEITSSLEPEDLFRNIARQIQRVAPYVRCLIASLDPAHKSFHIWHRESTIQDDRTWLRNDSEFFDWILGQVYEPGRPVNLANLHEVNLPWFASRISSGVQSYLFVPILLEGKSIAHISLSSKQIGAFSQDQVDALNLIASHLGLAIRNATLYRTIQERAARMEISGQIAKAIGSTLEPEELFQTIAHEIRKVTPFDRCVIGNVEQEKCQVWWAISDVEMESLSSKFNTRISVWHREVYEKNKIVSVPDLQEDPSEEAKFLASNNIRSLMIIPISQEGRCVAHLTLNSLQPRAYTSQQERFLESISDYLGPAIRNMSLYKASEERAARLAVLNELNQKITQNLDLNEVLESITDAALKLLHGDHVHIRLFDSSTGDWVIRSVSGSIPKSDVLKTLSSKRAANLALKEDGSIEPMILPDVQELRDWRRHEWACKFGIHSLIIHPLRVGATVIGAIACFSRERDYYRQEHLSLVSALASQASIAIQNAQLFQESEKKGKRLTTLIGAANKLAQELDLSMVLDSIVRAAGALFEGEAGLRLVEGNDLVRVATTPRGKEVMILERIPIDGTFSGGVVKRGAPLMSVDMNEESRSIRSHRRPEDLAATLVAPIKRGQRILGALHIFREKDYEFDEESISVAISFADQAAVAIDNARLHEAANKSLEFFRSVVDDNADAIILQDAERRIIHWNQGAEELYGYTEEEALGEKIDVIFTDDDLERQARGNPVFESGLTCHFEGIRVRKDGSYVPVGITLSPIKSEDGKVIALSAIHKNLSERNRAEEELRQSEEKYRTLIEFAADAIFVHGLDAKFIDVNHRACEILGYTREELLTLSVSDISVTFEHSKFLEQTNQMKEGEQSTFEGIHRRRDGTTFPVEICAGKVYSNGQPLTISLVRDITERRRAEEELKMARDEAEAASHAKSEFLSTMSHELRSPLNAVIGFSDLLLREAAENDDLTHRLVPKIRDSGKYLLKMIEELLDFDRIEAGKVRLKLEAASINDIVFRVVDSWRLRFPEGYSLTLQLDHACGIIGCDTTRISQILNNLIDNAVKYSPDGGTIRVCTIATPDEFQVSVQDEGMGITSEEKEIIFDRFRQLESGYTRRAGGLGIGLALAQELMQMHGGRIWVESKGEKGSTFSIALPRLQVTPRVEDLHSERTEEIEPNKNPWDGRKILVVDDVEHYHEYMKILMRDAGHLVSAHNGEEALEAANRELPDIILMDLRMPVMDGFESIQRLKADPETKGIPILAVTAQAMNQDKEDSIEAGADGFVTKPIQIESLKEEMWRVLGAKV